MDKLPISVNDVRNDYGPHAAAQPNREDPHVLRRTVLRRSASLQRRAAFGFWATRFPLPHAFRQTSRRWIVLTAGELCVGSAQSRCRYRSHLQLAGPRRPKCVLPNISIGRECLGGILIAALR
jgi:hypothetical protein